MVRILDWPAGADRFASEDWHLSDGSVSPGRGLGGRRQVIYRESRIWQCTVDLAVLHGRAPGLWRAFIDEAQGMFGLLRLPIVNRLTPIYNGSLAAFYAQFGITAAMQQSGIPFGDDALFSDGAGFALPSIADPTVAADVPAGARLLRLTGFLGEQIWVGAMFSVNDFAYRVAANSGGAIRINPPLREAIAAGTAVQVNRPTILVRQSEGTGGTLTLDPALHGSVSGFTVEEAFQRAGTGS